MKNDKFIKMSPFFSEIGNDITTINNKLDTYEKSLKNIIM